MSDYTLYDYWFVIYQRRKTIALISIFSVCFAVILSLVLPDVYQAKSVFYVPSKEDSLTFFSGVDQRQITRSLLVPEPKGEQQKIYLGILDSVDLRRRVLTLFPDMSLRGLEKNVDFNSGTDFLLKVYVRDRDPRRAAAVANAYVRLFNETLNTFSLNNTIEQRRSMEWQLSDTQQKLGAARGALATFERTHKMSTVDEATRQLGDLKSDLEKSLSDTQVKLREADEKTTGLRTQLERESKMYAESSTAPTSPFIDTIQKQLSDLEAQIAAARSDRGELHPDVIKLRSQYEEKKRTLAQEVKRVMENEIKPANSFVESLREDGVRLLVERRTLQGRIDGIKNSIANLDQRMTKFPTVRAEYVALKGDVDQFERLAENVKATLAETTAQAQRELQSIVVVDEAIPPERPVFPELLVNILIALGLGLVGGVFYAYFVDYVERFRLNLDADIKEIEKEYS